MVRRGILLGHCAEQSKGPAPHHLGGGGGGTLQARPGPRLRSRLARTSLRGGRAPGSLARPRRAGPDAGGGGGGTSLRPPGSGRGSPPPVPRARTARAAAHCVRSCPSPCAPRASLLLGRHRRPCPPPSPRLCPGGGGGGAPSRAAPGRGGGGAPSRAAPGRGGGGGWRPPAPRPGRALGAAVPYSASPIRTPALFLPPVARVGRCPHVAGPQRHWQRHRQAAERAQVVAFASCRLLSAAPCVGAAVRPWRRRTAFPGVGQPRAVGPPLGLAGQGGECCAGAGVSPPGGARSWPAGGAPPCWSRRLGCSGAVRCT